MLKKVLVMMAVLCLTGLVFADVCNNAAGYYLAGFVNSNLGACIVSMQLTQSGCTLSNKMGVLQLGGVQWPTGYPYSVSGSISGSSVNLTFSGSGSGSFSGTWSGSRYSHRMIGTLVVSNPIINQTVTFAGF